MEGFRKLSSISLVVWVGISVTASVAYPGQHFPVAEAVGGKLALMPCCATLSLSQILKQNALCLLLVKTGSRLNQHRKK